MADRLSSKLDDKRFFCDLRFSAIVTICDLRYAISLPSARVNEISAPDAYARARENTKPRLYWTRFDDACLCGYGGLLIE